MIRSFSLFSSTPRLAWASVCKTQRKSRIPFTTSSLSTTLGNRWSEIRISQKNLHSKNLHFHTLTKNVNAVRNYTGVEAEFYDLFRGEALESEVAFYRNLVKEKEGVSLELGCGTGRILLPLLSAGLSVEGLDNSADMLAICAEKAKLQKLTPQLHQSSMHSFDLKKKYSTIFIEGGSLMLTMNRAEVLQTLDRIYAHLAPSGQAVIELFIPLQDLQHPTSTWALRKVTTRPSDKATVLYSSAFKCNLMEQSRMGWSKYEIVKKGKLIDSYVFPNLLRWYSKYEFYLMLEKAGFRDIRLISPAFRPENERQTTMIFQGKRQS